MRIAIVEPLSPISLAAMGSQVAQWLEDEAKSQGMVPISADDVAQTLGRDQYIQLQACRGAPTCVAALTDGLKVPRIVVATLERDEQSYLVHLSLIDLSSGQLLCVMDRSVRIATRRLAVEVQAGLPIFLKGQNAHPGTLLLSANEPDATVTLDGQPAGSTPLQIALSPGRHEIELQKLGHFSVHRWVNITSDHTTKEELRLLRIPGTEQPSLPTMDSPPPVASATAVSKDPTRSSPRGHYRVPLGTYIAGGVAVAALGVGIGLGVSSGNLERSLSAGYDPTTHVYSGTRATAITARHRAIAADALFGAAGAAALTAIGWAIFAPQSNGLQPSVAATPQSVMLSLAGGF